MNVTSMIEILGYIAASLTTASFVPQALQTFRTRSTEGISVGMYSMFTAGVALWLFYGLAIGSPPVIVANAITLVLAATILTLALQSQKAARLPVSHPEAPVPVRSH